MGKYADEFYRKRKNLMAKIARLNRGLVLDDNSPTPIELRVIIPNDIVPPKHTNVTKKDLKEIDKTIESLDDTIKVQADISVRDSYAYGNIYINPFTGEEIDYRDAIDSKKRVTISYNDFLKYKRQAAYYKAQATKATKAEREKQSIADFNKLKSDVYNSKSEVIGERVFDYDFENRVKELEAKIASYNGRKTSNTNKKSAEKPAFSPPTDDSINRIKKYNEALAIREEFYVNSSKQESDNTPTEFRLTFDNVYERLNEYEQQEYWSDWFNNVKREDTEKAKNILQHAIVEIGLDNVARNIQNNALEIDDLIDRIKYGSGGGEKYDTYRSEVKADLVKLQELLLGRRLTLTESIYWTEVSETGESEY